MMILQINQLSKSFGADPILNNIKLEVRSRDRIAIVGRNGAGKSTLLKIIAGHLSYEKGELIKPKELTMGYLAQHTGMESQLTIKEELLSVFDFLKAMEKEMRSIEEKMATAAPAELETLMKTYDRLQQDFKNKGGYQYEADVRSVLHGLGFGKFDDSVKVQSLSGGQKTRLALGKLLLTQPDLLILDEPTNHLDIDTLTWLEHYLQGYSGAILIVSHDRYFLDKVVSQVYEVSRTESKKYLGNYSAYLEQKAEQYEKDLKLYEKQQDEIAKLQDFVDRNLARASTTKRAQSRRKQLERMDVMAKPLGDEKSAAFRFEITKQSGNDVLRVQDVSISYDGQPPLLKNLTFGVTRGESAALVGPNGIGKSTLLKTIMNTLSPESGSISYGSNVTIGYYDQEQAELTSSKRVLDELWDEYPDMPEKEIRTCLGNFLFSGDDVLKPVRSLSGGEKARVALAKLMLQKANFLILDEPTNHLDLDSKEVLENALIDYPGTLLFVSHDRYFINRIATRVLELSQDHAEEYLGDYDYYTEKKAQQLELEEMKRQEKEQAQPAGKVKQDTKRTYEEEKEWKKKERQRLRRIEEIEAAVSSAEEKISANEELLCDPEVYQDHEKVQTIHAENEALNQELEQLLAEWEELSSEE
ncbi:MULTISPECIES: ABC-F family ATP-binding cassette domain-containing protein [Bacillus]|jgi:ATP-binding cassette subfamily F protein 3|uniref:ABC-F family ATP-binding cassette domain-containing protein n=1 Tax=Bacillus TaxID=1386 RepID=UPI000205969E|nr:ABC-F family ATP-binding cassette domain-containing protein [Bacillus amyloliquefaciens]AIW32633.1 multidrug ABC transporter ATP-binding protein [Bacillus subtilis]AEB22739.1 ABC transporter ATP-binding YdiF [Bacillus amyloliquefaciens TA208]AEB62116.1 putative ABC transporter ATP-binding YdiF [Bacillus amyloliquefaciens LL3]AEK87726.1 putative ABC transporter (ATP-binding protein) [Bacillus amyloliquefaciens XH7]AZV91988.1 multidrug ABC transporter ATP-binding protein [Bacillus amyloliquef